VVNVHMLRVGEHISDLLLKYIKKMPINDCYLEIVSQRFLINDFLRRVLEFAVVHVPFYKRISLPKGGSHMEWLQRFPIITKQHLTKHFRDFLSDLPPRKGRRFNSTGGSTGVPVRILQDAEYATWGEATIRFFYLKLLGLEGKVGKRVILWGSERDIFRRSIGLKAKMINWINGITYLNSFCMSSDDMKLYIQRINRLSPVYIRGYAGSLYQLAKFSRKQNYTISSPSVIHSAAETLYPYMRREIEEAFGCKVHDFYGSREVGAIAGECQRGRMHIFDFNNFIEIVDEKNRPVSIGKPGRVIVTTLHNFSMPLIRYEIGDLAEVGTLCLCGMNSPTIGKITGPALLRRTAMNI